VLRGLVGEFELISELLIKPDVPYLAPAKKKSENVAYFDSILGHILKICEKYGVRMPEEETERLWLDAAQGIYDIRKSVGTNAELSKKDKNNLDKFISMRISTLMKKMSAEVSFRKIVDFMESVGQKLQY